MSQLGDMSTGLESSAAPAIKVSSDIMVGMVTGVFFIVVIIFFFIVYLYANHVWAPSRALRLRPSRLVFAASDPVSFPRYGLGSAVLEALPVTVFHDSVEELECAVCLCELSHGEQSHSNCPLCRSPVAINPTPISSYESAPATEVVFSLTESSPGVFPTNMYGVEDRIISTPVEPASTSATTSIKRSVMLVIDIPTSQMEFPLPGTPFPISEMTKTPISSRRRTLTRLLSRGKKAVESFSASPGEGSDDIEQGLRGAAGDNWRGITPRIPKNS